MSASKRQQNLNPSGLQTVSFSPRLVEPTHKEGQIYYLDSRKSLTVDMDVPGVHLQVGQEMYTRVINATGSTIPNGACVYVSGANGPNLPEISLAKADTLETSLIAGMATHDIENNSTGYITIFGNVGGVDTSSFSAGDILYLSPSVAGGVTNVKPNGINYVVGVGIVVVSSLTGEIQIQRQQLGQAEEPQAEVWITNNSTETTINTVNVWEQVTQLTQTGSILGWTHNGTGTLTAGPISAGGYTMTVNVSSAAVAPGKTYEFALSVNDVIKTETISSRRYSSGDVGNQGATGLITVAAGDEIKLEVRNITDNTNILVINANLNLHRLT